MGEVNQSNVHLLLPWKVAALAALWAADLGVSRLEAQRRFYGTKFYRDLEDESTKLWTLSPEQLYLIFHTAAPPSCRFALSGMRSKGAGREKCGNVGMSEVFKIRGLDEK